MVQYKNKCRRNAGIVEECGEGRQFMARVRNALRRAFENFVHSQRHGFASVFKADLPWFIIAATVADLLLSVSAPAGLRLFRGDKSYAALRCFHAAVPTLWVKTQWRRQWRKGSLLTENRCGQAVASMARNACLTARFSRDRADRCD